MQSTVSSLWSPTNDPVFNFLINTSLIVGGLALVPGIVYVGLWIIAVVIGVAILAYFVAFLVWLAQLSPTGSVVAVFLGLTTAFLGVRAIARRWNWVRFRRFLSRLLLR